MQEASISKTQIQTPQSLAQPSINTLGQDSIFNKYKASGSHSFSAFKLVRLQSSESSLQSDQSSDQRDHLGRRKKRGCYRKYTTQQKQQAVRKIMNGYDVKDISKQYEIPRRNLLRWKKNGCQRKQGGGRPTDNELQKMLYSKILSNDLKNERQIRQEAKKLSKCQNFKASKGWYCKFNKRFVHWTQKNGTSRQTVQCTNIESGQYQNL